VIGNGRGGVVLGAPDLARPADVDGFPTPPEETDLLSLRRHRRFRRIFLTLLFALLALGLSGMLGVKSRTTTAQGGGYELKLTYGQVSRPGLATPWSLEIRHPGGFDGPVTVASSNAYLDMFDENGFDPQPSKVTQTPDEIIWEFEPPPGDTLGVSFDARVNPGVQWGRSGTTSVLVDGQPAVTARYKTWVLP
jgi:hypothetical protein